MEPTKRVTCDMRQSETVLQPMVLV